MKFMKRNPENDIYNTVSARVSFRDRRMGITIQVENLERKISSSRPVFLKLWTVETLPT